MILYGRLLQQHGQNILDLLDSPASTPTGTSEPVKSVGGDLLDLLGDLDVSSPSGKSGNQSGRIA